MPLSPHQPAEGVHDILRQSRKRPLDRVFAPSRIAVIGASEGIGTVGRAVMENLQEFAGDVFPVNPRHTSILGRPCFASIAEVPAVPDLAIIATRAETVPGIIRDCAAAGVGGAVILSAGFKECGPHGADLERAVLAEARRGGLRIIGPNCLGLMRPRAGLNATFAGGLAQEGHVAFLSQSGALCAAILDWSRRELVGFSTFVSVGSMADVGWGDLIDWLGDDPFTKSIIIYMESVGDARAFLSAAREVALTKPVIVIKVGRTAAAARAAASHTGALTGSDAVLDAAFRRAGVLRVDSIEELFDMAEVLAKQPRPPGPRLAIVTNAGGPGALATDALVAGGGELAPLHERSLTRLNEFLPAHWSHANPVDVLGDATPERFSQAVQITLADPNIDGALVVLTPQAMTDAAGIATAISSLPRPSEKPLLASWMGGPGVEDGRNILNHAGIPTYDYPDTAARVFARMWQNSADLRALYETPAILPETTQHARAAAIIRSACRAGRVLLAKVECNELLSAYGIPTVTTHLAETEEQAVGVAERLGFPVVLKLHSGTITHKSDVGGVKLGLRDSVAVARAWREIKAAVSEKDFAGVTVEPMIAASAAVELIIGSSVDAQFGPVLLFGAGGVMVEISDDHILGLPPLTVTLARRMIEGTRISAALAGVRGRAPVDVSALEQILVRFSRLIIEHPRIKEMEINPLLATPHGLVALDVRVILHGGEVADHALPRPAIRPYPIRHVSAWTMRDGSEVTLRPICPEDEPCMVAFHHTLSEGSVHSRYFSVMKLDERTSHDRLSRLCFIDYDREMALVAERREGSHREILAVGRLSRRHGLDEAEFALLVGDPWQGKGLGTELLRRLVAVGREEKIGRITAEILPENHRMQAVARKLGFQIKSDLTHGECRAVLDLHPPDPSCHTSES
ncbi:MAG: bifunctional acetate--CoA ligase family protein/GNAT family N-acetyltransferase [Prosthecobacter sp.]